MIPAWYRTLHSNLVGFFGLLVPISKRAIIVFGFYSLFFKTYDLKLSNLLVQKKTNNEIVLVKKVVVHHCKLSNLLSQMASSIRRIENFVIKYGKIERQPQSDRMRGRHF